MSLPPGEDTMIAHGQPVRRIIDNFSDEVGLPVVPTFAAFMLERGYRTYREAQDSDGFALWQAERWEEFANANGLVSPFPSGDDRRRFIDWLDARAVDHVARSKVEA